MILRNFWSLILVATILTSLRAFSTEGFSTELYGMPSTLKTAWDSTYAIRSFKSDRFELGAATLIRTRTTPTQQEFDFVTVEQPLLESCPTGQACPSLFLVLAPRLREDPGTSPQFEPTRGTLLSTIQVIQRNPKNRLVFLRATASLGFKLSSKPISVAPQCHLPMREPVFSVGFPKVNLRTNPLSRAIAERQIQMKRWTIGLYTGPTGELSGTTVDSISGDRGSPIFNGQGQLVGVVVDSKSSPHEQHRFVGKEDPNQLLAHTLSVPCEALGELVHSLEKSN